MSKPNVSCASCGVPLYREPSKQKRQTRFYCSARCRRRFAGRRRELALARLGQEFGKDACWPWPGATDRNGYPYLWSKGKTGRAHRISYETFIGAIPGGMCVLHSCDNRRCVNPHHLFVGTHQDNQRDKVTKDRQARGRQINTCKLTPAKVIALRMRATLGERQKQLASEYGITLNHCCAIVNRRAWRWL